MKIDTPGPKPKTVRTDLVGYRTCPLCEATCGLTISRRTDSAGERHWLIRGDTDDPFSGGYLCPKGTALGALHDDPNRLRQPMQRVGDDPATAQFVPISWEEALNEIDDRLTKIIDETGTNSVGAYLGNPIVHSHEATLFASNLARTLGSPHLFSASTVDQMAKHVSSGLLFGDPDAIPVPDLDRTDYLLMLGANPLESNGSLCTAPNFGGRLEALIERGGKFVVVDPRRTKTAGLATEHLPIVPGTDALLLAAIAHTLVTDEHCDATVVADYHDEVVALGKALQPFTPERVGERCGIDAVAIRRIAAELATARRAAAYSRIGAQATVFGTLAAWLTDVINIVTGNLDRAGGAMFPTPPFLAVGSGTGRGFRTGRWQSRVNGSPEVRGEMPVAELAREITTPGDGRLRALIVVAGNPVLSTPEGHRLDAALGELEFMVSVDPWLNETSRRASIILPPPSALERSHYDIAFSRLAIRNVAKWSPPLIDTPDAPPEWWILSSLAGIIAGRGPTAGDHVAEAVVTETCERLAQRTGADPDELRRSIDTGGRSPADQIVDAMIRASDRTELTLDDLVVAPHGLDLGPLNPALHEVLKTPNGRIDLMPDALRADLDRLVERLDEPYDDTQLLLVGRRDLRSNNSWLHNVETLVRGKERCTLQLHPADADARGIAADGTVRVTSAAGEVIAPVAITEEIRRGVVSLPHGYGHHLDGIQLDVAGERPGVNANILTDAQQVDPLCGTAQLNAIPVEVAPL